MAHYSLVMTSNLGSGTTNIASLLKRSFIFSIIDGAKFHAATKITSISLKSTESAAKTGMCEPGVYNPCFKGLSSITKSTNSEFMSNS